MFWNHFGNIERADVFMFRWMVTTMKAEQRGSQDGDALS